MKIDRTSKSARRRFTLIEVVVAIAILGIGLVGFLGITASTSRRMNRAYNRWEQQHALAQAVEMFLLTHVAQRPSDEFFPYSEYDVQFEIGSPENLPEGVEETLDKWKLVRIKATLTDSTNEIVSTIAFDKLVYEE
jgi:prepilin-type N-terminal cleavage/methylation domain-containing protein